MRYPYGTNPKWQPRPGWRRWLHRIELRLAYKRHDMAALAVRERRLSLQRRFGR